jgi:hypothetical protein
MDTVAVEEREGGGRRGAYQICTSMRTQTRDRMKEMSAVFGITDRRVHEMALNYFWHQWKAGRIRSIDQLFA